jgi:hypothetical protein
VGGQHTGDLVEVLDRHRQSREKPAFGGGALHQLLRVLACAVETQRRQRIDFAVDGLDACVEHVEQIERRHFAGFKFGHDGGCSFLD